MDSSRFMHQKIQEDLQKYWEWACIVPAFLNSYIRRSTIGNGAELVPVTLVAD